MGLLDRARTLDDTVYKINMNDPVEFAESIIRSPTHSPDQIDYPAGVFRAFQSLIGFTRGSLMLPDNHLGEFYPWITEGFDRTTIRRLRIPFDFTSLQTDKTSVSAGLDPDYFSQMLSNREFGLVSNILLLKITSDDSCAALIFATDCPWTGLPGPEMISAIDILNREFHPAIRKSRKLTDEDPNEEITDLQEWFDSWGDNSATLVILDITGAIDTLIELIPGLELYRSRRDVINLIRHITGRMGRFHDLKDGRILILFPPERLPDHDLYLHQLSRSFASAFSLLSSPPDFPAVFRNWPEDQDVVRDSLAGFF